METQLYRHIVCATRGGEESQRTEERAIQVARESGGALTFLYVVDGGDMVYLIHQTGLTWGNLSVNVQKLEAAGYVSVEKRFVERRPQTWVKLTEAGRQAFRAYRSQLTGVLDDLPE